MSVQRKKLYVTPIAQALALMLLTSASAQAQVVPTAAAGQLKEVVVSGSRNARFSEDLPLSTDIIEAGDIEINQMGDLRDVAKNLPNVSVKRAPARFGVTGRGNAVGADGNAGFSIRGQGGNRVLMLVDGVRQSRSYINGSTAFGRDSVALGLVKQIEVVRGPSSSLYGSDGLAGMVNFITLSPDDILGTASGQPRALGGKAWLSHSGDDNGNAVGAVVAGQASDSLQWLISAGTNRASGLENKGDNDSANIERTTPNPQTSSGDAVLAKLVWQANAQARHQFTLEHVSKDDSVELLSSRAKLPLTGTAAVQAAAIAAESSARTMSRDRATWAGDYKVNSSFADKLQATLSWQDSSMRQDGQTLRSDGGLRVRQTDYQELGWQASVQADKLLPMSGQWSQLLSYGADYSRIEVSSFADGRDPAPLPVFTPRHYFPDSRDQHQAVFVQSEFVGGNWSITPGLRYDQFDIDVLSQAGYYPGVAKSPGKSLSGSAVSPKVAALYRVTPQWSVYGNFAKGFRAPEGQQINSALEGTDVKLLPNPDLKPEESRNLELGIKVRMDRWRLDAAAFSSRYTNLIQEKKDLGRPDTTVPASPTNQTLFQTVNIDRAKIHGFEVKLQADLGRLAAGKWATAAGYGQTKGSNITTGQPLSYLDPAKLSLELMYSRSDWDVRVSLNHSAGKKLDELDDRFIPKSKTQLQFVAPSSTTLDVHSQWRVRKNVHLNAAVINLTDKKYWNWSDVQGLASNATPLVVDAYSQPGRHVNVSMVVDF